MKYINDGTYNRFIARDKANPSKFYRVAQEGMINGDPVDYVRVDETLNVTIHNILNERSDGTMMYEFSELDLAVTWS